MPNTPTDNRTVIEQNTEIVPEKLKAILFDFDGTLVPCLDLRAMRRQVLELTHSLTGIPRTETDGLMSVELIEKACDWVSQDGGDPNSYRLQAHQLIVDIEQQAADVTTLRPSVIEMLSELRRSGFKLGIVTRNSHASVITMFPAVNEYIDALVTRDNAEYLKPDPRHLTQCLTLMGCNTNHALMIGDGILDIDVAHQLDMPAVAVLDGHNARHELEMANPERIIEKVEDLINLLIE